MGCKRALGSQVATDLTALGVEVDRAAGVEREETALELNDRVPRFTAPPAIVVVDGLNPESWAAGLPAAERGLPIVLTRDIYIPAGDVYFWQGAIRATDDIDRAFIVERQGSTDRIIIDVLYGDQHGGQRVIARFALTPREAGGYLTSLGRQWNVDRADPR